MKIAKGGQKGTIATMEGYWEPITRELAEEMGPELMRDPRWVQAGMDPTRSASFYNRETMQPIVEGEQVLHSGPLVLVKNPVYGDIEDFPFKEGGAVTMAKGGILGAIAKTAEKGLEAAAKGAKVAVKAAPQDEALRLAQLRAALPPAQGGLGLPANNTPMDRANAMEFNYVRRSRNPSGPFNDVNYAMFLEHKGDVDDALDKLRSFGKGQWLGRAEVPVEKIQKDIVRSIKKRKLNEPYQATAASLAREANPNDIVNAGGIWDAPEIAESIIEDAAEKGIGGILTNDGAIIWDPDLIRSREAAFDPWRKDAATAAAFGVAAPDLLAKEQEPEDRLTIDEFLKQMKER
jgi:hypothetical protein